MIFDKLNENNSQPSATQKAYDNIAHQYDNDYHNIRHSSYQSFINQVAEHLQNVKPKNILDLCVGTGDAILPLAEVFPEAHFTGNDISAGMLKVAEKKLEHLSHTNWICDDVANIKEHVQDNSKDLILCHYLFAYANRKQSIKQSYQMLSPGGYLSIVTTTKQNLSSCKLANIFSPVLRVNKHLSEVETPASHQEMITECEKLGFSLVTEHCFTDPVSFCSSQDIKAWALDSGWAASYLHHFGKTKLLLIKCLWNVFCKI
jgi:ubiquinone/menaquinone biosynthesis C-methylase UbiE